MNDAKLSDAARALGRMGGRSTSAAKSEAAKLRNAKRKADGKPEGGRPRSIEGFIDEQRLNIWAACPYCFAWIEYYGPPCGVGGQRVETFKCPECGKIARIKYVEGR